MDRIAAAESSRLGGNPHGARSTSLNESIARNQDLILVMTGQHQQDLVSRYPPLLKRTFVLGQFAQIAAELTRHSDVKAIDEANGTETDRLRSFVATAGMNRYKFGAVDRTLDIEDPFQKDASVHRRVADQIDNAVTEVSRALMSVVTVR